MGAGQKTMQIPVPNAQSLEDVLGDFGSLFVFPRVEGRVITEFTIGWPCYSLYRPTIDGFQYHFRMDGIEKRNAQRVVQWDTRNCVLERAGTAERKKQRAEMLSNPVFNPVARSA
ncbi:hypothetical protein CYMTET_19877 [Cymbomonas tetramitiformis]|uniref:Uncharacterized protein n=1 Tax=Cymbomonas tetramitiformis TaxID=36881 RepID=A0AAE0L4R6_9CHLO|nr:hypothetical protein CYMTET_19877 [Cymbomonas tetramitiformis]